MVVEKVAGTNKYVRLGFFKAFVGCEFGMADEDEVPEPKPKVFIQAVSGYIGGNLAKRFAKEGFEVLGTLKAPADPKPLAVSTVVEPTETALAAAFHECVLTVLDLVGDLEAAEKFLSVVTSSTEPIENPKVLVGVSSVMTWARTSPSSDEPEMPLTEAEYKRRRPHSSYKDLVSLEKLVTKSKREGLRTHVVAAGLTYGAEEDLFHSLFKAAWSCQPLPLLSLTDGSNVRPHFWDAYAAACIALASCMHVHCAAALVDLALPLSGAAHHPHL